MDANAIKTEEQLSASAALPDDGINAPWSLHFDRDGTEDVVVICDADGDDLLYSRCFWRAEGDDPEIPLTLPAMRLIVAAPKLLAALINLLGDKPDIQNRQCIRCGRDYQAYPENEGGNCLSNDCPAYQARAAIAEATAAGHDGGCL
jgi:hypothetical protein